MVALVVVLGACGSDEKSKGDVVGTPVDDAAASTQVEGDAPAGDSGDGCRLATKEEVAAALGVEVATAEGMDDGCTYAGADGSFLFGYVYTQDTGKSTFEGQREAGELIEGIGDGVLYFPGGGMYVLKGDALINMTAFANDTLANDAALRTALETVARLMVDRL